MNYREADARCQEIIARVEADALDEFKARRQIAELLEQTRLAWRTAHECNRNFAMQVRLDMGAEMSSLLYTKVMQDDGRGLEFTKAKGASVAGWARQLLRTANLSLLRKVATGPIESHDTDAVKGISVVKHDGPFQNSERDAVGYEIAMEWFVSRSRQLRDNSRTQAAYQSVLFSLDVPVLVRPEYDERIRLRTLFEQDPAVGYRSARTVRDIHDGLASSNTVDDGFLALWDDYPYDDIDRVVSKHENFANALVAGALADKPRPIRTTVRDFRVKVREAGSGRGWRAKADELVEAYLALEFEAYSSFDARGASKHSILAAGQALTRARADHTFEAALNHPEQTLGSTREEVMERLDVFMSELADRPVELVAPMSFEPERPAVEQMELLVDPEDEDDEFDLEVDRAMLLPVGADDDLEED